MTTKLARTLPDKQCKSFIKYGEIHRLTMKQEMRKIKMSQLVVTKFKWT